MTKPTLESLNEAAKTCGYVYRDTMDTLILELIRAHALTLDKLHNRKEVSEAETFYREVVAAWLNDTLWECPLDGNDLEAIAMIESKFAELRAPKEPEWAYCSADGCHKKGSPNADCGPGCRNRY